MRAIVLRHPGGPEVLELRDVAMPEPGPGWLRVRVVASGVNRADLLQRRGGYPAPPGWPAEIPGLEYAGAVDAPGPDVAGFAPGEAVMGLVGGGGYAEYVVAPAAEVLKVPAGLPLRSAAAVPEAFITAHDALFTQLHLAGGETLLIHAVGSGVGTAGLQLAKAAGARVLGTNRSRWKLERARDLGLDVAIPAGAGDDWAEAVLRETGGGGVDAILDLVGGDYLPGNIRVLAPRGRIIVVGLVAGRAAQLDLGAVLSKRLTIVGTALRSRPSTEKAETTAAFARDVLPLLADGRVRPVIDRAYPPDEAAQAHERMEQNAGFGKILIDWAGGGGDVVA